MATFEVQGPDGSVYEVEAPDQNAAVAGFKRFQSGKFSTPGVSTPPPANPAPAQPGTLDDLNKTVPASLARGFAHWLGGPADAANAVAGLADRAEAYFAGKPVAQVQAENDARALVPTTAVDRFGSANLIRSLEDQTGKPLYQPQTTLGKYVNAVGEALPSMAGVPMRGALEAGLNMVAAPLAAEAAGQATEGTGYEPLARAAAGVAAPLAASRVITPVRTSPARAPLTQALRDEGIDLSAGQTTGSKGLQWLESSLQDMPGGGGGAAFAERQGRQFNQAVARRMGEDADLLTPDVMQRASTRIGQEFRDLSARNTLQYDAQMGNDIVATAREYSHQLDALQRPVFHNLVNDIRNRIIQGNGTIPGNVYQSARSALSQLASDNANSPFGRAVAGLRNALDGAMNRSISPADAQAWHQARYEWGNMRQIERAMAGAGSQVAQGFVSPSQLRGSVAGNNPQAYVRGQTDLGELARAAEGVLRPLPNSGTAPRQHIENLMKLVSQAVVGGAAGGLPLAVGAMAAPGVASRVLMSPPVQAWLRNTAVAPGGQDMIRSLINARLGLLASQPPAPELPAPQ